MGSQQQLRKVHQPAPFAGFLIGPIDPQHGAGENVRLRCLDMRRAQTLVLLGVDVPLALSRWPAGLVQVQFPADALDQPQLIIGIENLEVLRQTDLLPVGLEQTQRDAVEGAHPQMVDINVQHVLDAAAHLPRRLVGEGDGQD